MVLDGWDVVVNEEEAKGVRTRVVVMGLGAFVVGKREGHDGQPEDKRR